MFLLFFNYLKTLKLGKILKKIKQTYNQLADVVKFFEKNVYPKVNNKRIFF